MALTAGTRLGAYEIAGTLGAGGMGEVYRATDTNLRREVAIKILPPAFASNADRIARFQREAEALAALNHSNIAQIYGLERSGETTALAMELVEGPTLADRIAEGPIPTDEALTIAIQIADALDAAHEQNIVHRDLKPANIKLKRDGTVKVLDFGIATAPESALVTSGQRSPTLLTPALTEAGVLLGTAAYMSPEQARGRTVDRRTDIWAFGCVLYEMLTGQPAFGGEDVTTTLARVLEREADAGSLPADISPNVSRTIALCLQKDLNKRIADIRDVKLALTGAFETRSPSDRRPAGPRSVALTGGAVIVAFLLGVAAVHWLPLGIGASSGGAGIPTWASEPVRFAVYPPEGTTFGDTFAVSRDGRRIAFVARAANGSSQLWLQSLNGGDALPLAGTEAAEAPFWSPDGEWIGFFAGKALKRVRSAGGEPAQTITVLVAREQEVLHGTWGADGVIVFQNNVGQGLLRVSVQDGSVSPATKFEGVTAHLYPEFIGDTRDFLYDDGPDIKIGSLGGAPSRTLLTGWVIAGYLPGYVLYAGADRGLFARPFDAAALEFSGPAFRVLDDIPVAGTGQVPVSVSSNGVLVYRQQIDQPAQFQWIDRDGSVSKPVTSPGYYGGVLGSWDLAPGNDRIAVRRSDKGGSGTLWLWDIARGNEQPITQNGDSLNPVFSPDGKSLVFSSARGHPPDLFRKVFGQGDEQLLAGGPAAMFAESWDPSRNSIVYEEVEQQSGADLWSLSLDDLKTRPLPVNTNYDETDGRVSPGGHWIAYVSNASGENRIVLAGLPSGQPRCPVSVGGGVMPRWRADGRELYYISADRRLMAVKLTSTETTCSLSPPEALFSIPAGANEGTSGGYEPRSDGQRFLFLTRVQDARRAPLRVTLNWPALSKQ